MTRQRGCRSKALAQRHGYAELQSSPGPGDGCYTLGRRGIGRLLRFQSSPVPRDGCYDDLARLLEFLCISFNPHPSRGTGATCVGGILGAANAFQSSPVPRDGCYVVGDLAALRYDAVSILTRPEGRVLPKIDYWICRRIYSFNPHPSRGTGATVSARLVASVRPVSILTRPEGRVLPDVDTGRWPRCFCFNPHPSRGTGATTFLGLGRGCFQVSILTRPEGRVLLSFAVNPLVDISFNPHPSRGTGATGQHPAFTTTAKPFQSSPVPRDGCYCRPK